MCSILLVDDDVAFCSMLSDYLRLHGMGVTARHSGPEGLQELRSNQYELMLLDVMLPGLDGFEVLQEIGKLQAPPVMMLTAMGEEHDRIRGLDNGADDYVTKPINPRELLSRMRAVLRRSIRSRTHSGEPERAPRKIEINRLNRTFTDGAQTIPLTEIELAMLELFLRTAGEVLTRDDLAREIFQRSFHPTDRSPDMHVSRLRKKLSLLSETRASIQTVRNSGYMLHLL